MLKLTNRSEQRFKYLECLYKLVGGSTLYNIKHEKLSRYAGLPLECANDALCHWESEGVLEVLESFWMTEGFHELVYITDKGVKEYETIMKSRGQVADTGIGGTGHTGDNWPQGGLATPINDSNLVVSAVPRNKAAYRCPANVQLCNIDHRAAAQKKEHLIMKVILFLRRVLTSPFVETGVRFLLSKWKG